MKPRKLYQVRVSAAAGQAWLPHPTGFRLKTDARRFARNWLTSVYGKTGRARIVTYTETRSEEIKR
jgi:hypothetical protein